MEAPDKAMRVAYHFTGPKLRDGSPIPAIGKKLVFHGKPIMCEQGLHFSLHPLDALKYAPGPLLHLVRYGGTFELGGDKGVCTERTILATIDATRLLRKFACDEALSMLPPDAPKIVRRYLQTQDESIREAAWEVARAAAWTAAWEAAREAARAAAWAAREAARAAAWAAAWEAAREAARAAAWAAAWAAAREAARAAAWAAQRDRFLMLVEQEFKNKTI